jgi:hypothetical protein
VRLSHEPNIGLIFPPNNFFTVSRAKLIVETVARYRLPAIYSTEAFMAEGGLMHYRNDALEPFRLAPFYVDRILKGIKPGDLPVQLPTRYKFIVNRKTASALGIEVPLGLLLAADEVIERRAISCADASSSPSSAVRRRRGRSSRSGNNRECAASVFCPRPQPTTRFSKRGSRCSSKSCGNWGGPPAKTSRSRPAGEAERPAGFGRMPPNWFASIRTC